MIAVKNSLRFEDPFFFDNRNGNNDNNSNFAHFSLFSFIVKIIKSFYSSEK